jgi:hypothetical protein
MIEPYERGETKVVVRTLGAILHHARGLAPLASREWPDSFPPWAGEWSAPSRHRQVRVPPTRRLQPADAVRRSDLAWGDALFVATRNSTYCINPAPRGWFVWGGWFARHGATPAVVGINGCTWGGSVLHSDLLAAPGLFLEFANGVTTTRIRHVHILRADSGRK